MNQSAVRGGYLRWRRWTVGEIDARECRRFATVDTAGTSKQKAAQRRGKPPSWSVCQVWDYWPKTGFMFLRHVWRDQVNWDGLKAGVRGTLHDRRVRSDRPVHLICQQAKLRTFKGLTIIA